MEICVILDARPPRDHYRGYLLRSIPSPKNIENCIFKGCHDSKYSFETVWGQYFLKILKVYLILIPESFWGCFLIWLSHPDFGDLLISKS